MAPMMTPDLYTNNFNDTQRAWFYAEYERVRKDELVAILLAFFLGSFGAHHFYLGRKGLGFLYAAFFWTGVPGLIAIVECFLMPGRVRAYNAMQAVAISNAIQGGATPPINITVLNTQPVPMTQICPNCAATLQSSANFCSKCGAVTTITA